MKVKIKKSSKKDKKMKATFNDKKTIHFGASGMSDYTKHKDKERKQKYINRHKKRENWNKPDTAGSLSRFILWGPSGDIKKNIKYYKNKFNLK